MIDFLDSCSNPTGLQPDVKVVSYTLTTGACNGKFVTNTVITLGCANNKGIASCFGISSCSLNITCQADTTWSPTGTNVPCVKGKLRT